MEVNVVIDSLERRIEEHRLRKPELIQFSNLDMQDFSREALSSLLKSDEHEFYSSFFDSFFGRNLHEGLSDSEITKGQNSGTDWSLVITGAKQANQNPLEQFLIDLNSSHDSTKVTADYVLTKVSDFFEKYAMRRYRFEEVLQAVISEIFEQQNEFDFDTFKSELEAKFFEQLEKHLLAFQAAYVSKLDLAEFGYSSIDQKEILQRLERMQLLGKITTRSEALEAVIGSNSNFGVFAFLGRTGADLEKFVITSEKISSISGARQSELISCKCISREQFHRDNLEAEIQHEVQQSQNYPAIKKELEYCKLGIEFILQKFLNGELNNLPELEEFCIDLQRKREKFEHAKSCNLSNTGVITASKAAVALVKRDWDKKIKSITFALGFQGAEHEGLGLRHILYQRTQDKRLLAELALTQEAAIEQFIKNALFHCATSATAYVPSRKSPNTHCLLFSEIKDLDNQYISLVLGETDIANNYYAVTGIFHKNKAALRKAILAELKGYLETLDIALQRKNENRIILKNINDFLRRQGIDPLKDSELGIAATTVPIASSHPIVLSASSSDEEFDFEEGDLAGLSADSEASEVMYFSDQDEEASFEAVDGYAEAKSMNMRSLAGSVNKRSKVKIDSSLFLENINFTPLARILSARLQ